ncbi:MAG: hypothetical protein GF421_07935 [Candidatus Aminicenantes bacterium]|nr:hypothetical protein [Candidatus Aminicenantes bacterium]
MIDLFNAKERRILVSAGLFLLGVGLFYFLGARVQVKGFIQNQETLKEKKEELANLEEAVIESKQEYMRWIQAQQDIEYVKKKYIYHGEKSIQEMRWDLNRLHRKTEIKIGTVKYDYHENTDENIHKASLSFDVTGTYVLIKEFLCDVESFQKFLYVEKMTFKEIERQTGKIKLGISLAAYYEK